MRRKTSKSIVKGRRNFIYFALFVIAFLTFLLVSAFQSKHLGNKIEMSQENFIEKVDWKGDFKQQLIGAYIYSSQAPEVKAANARFIKEEMLPKKHRIIKPGYMVTMDYDPERLNIYIRDDYSIRDAKFG